jgi:hypothetical protein
MATTMLKVSLYPNRGMAACTDFTSPYPLYTGLLATDIKRREITGYFASTSARSLTDASSRFIRFRSSNTIWGIAGGDYFPSTDFLKNARKSFFDERSLFLQKKIVVNSRIGFYELNHCCPK